MVVILMATYNGADFLKEQLQSIVSQTYDDWVLYIRDDNSSDGTKEIIDSFISKDIRIRLISDNLSNLGSSQNFNEIMKFCKDKGRYFMFCDQDDVWLEDKIESSLKRIQVIEEDKPALVFCAQTLVDSKGNSLNIINSFNHPLKLEILLTVNFVYGCTMIINHRLMNKCVEVSKEAENHDYWIALVAAVSNSNWSYINRPLMLYRQHSNNVSGNYQSSSFMSRFKRLLKNSEQKLFLRRIAMLEDLLKIKNINGSDRKLISGYIVALKSAGVKGLVFIIKSGIRKLSFISSVNFYFSVLRS